VQAAGLFALVALQVPLPAMHASLASFSRHCHSAVKVTCRSKLPLQSLPDRLPGTSQFCFS